MAARQRHVRKDLLEGASFTWAEAGYRIQGDIMTALRTLLSEELTPATEAFDDVLTKFGKKMESQISGKPPNARLKLVAYSRSLKRTWYADWTPTLISMGGWP